MQHKTHTIDIARQRSRWESSFQFNHPNVLCFAWISDSSFMVSIQTQHTIHMKYTLKCIWQAAYKYKFHKPTVSVYLFPFFGRRGDDPCAIFILFTIWHWAENWTVHFANICICRLSRVHTNNESIRHIHYTHTRAHSKFYMHTETMLKKGGIGYVSAETEIPFWTTKTWKIPWNCFLEQFGTTAFRFVHDFI